MLHTSVTFDRISIFKYNSTLNIRITSVHGKFTKYLVQTGNLLIITENKYIALCLSNIEEMEDWFSYRKKKINCRE